MYKLFICLRYLRSRKIFLFSVVGIIIGIAVLIVTSSLFDGFSRELRERIRGVSSHVVVKRLSSRGGRPLYQIERYRELAALIRAVPHVVAVAPHVEGLATASCQGAILPRGVQIVGIDPDLEVGRPGSPGVSDLGRYLVEGSAALEAPAGSSHAGILVGTALLGEKACPLGETLTLATIRGHPGAEQPDLDLRTRRFSVAGRFRTRMNEYDRGLAYVTLREAQEFLGMGDAVSQIAVRLDDYRRAPEAVRAIRAALDASEDLREETRGLGVLTWEQIPGKRILLQAVGIEKNIQFVILLVILFVAGFSIIAIFTLIVDMKTRDIGILRALGATSGGISVLYLLNGTLISAAGSVLGVLLGIAFAYGLDPIEKAVHFLTGFRLFPPEVYYLDAVPAEVNPGMVALAVAASLVVSLFFSLYPAWKAARLNPIEAIRHE